MDVDDQRRKLRKSYNTLGHSHELTFSTYQQRPILALPGVAQEFLDGLDHSRKLLDFQLFAYIVMPDHCHVLVGPRGDSYDVATILKRIKGPVAKRLLGNRADVRQMADVKANSQLQPEHRVWERGGGYDRNVISATALVIMIRYIHLNPIRRGLCSEPKDWPWSSASAYDEGIAPIPVDFPEIW